MTTSSVISDSTLWCVREATGNVLAVYEYTDDTLHWKEQHLYGSSRLGMVHPGVAVYPNEGLVDSIPYYIQTKEQPHGARRYEMTNRILTVLTNPPGNVAMIISDRKFPVDNGGDITYIAEIHSALPAHLLSRFTPSKVPRTFGFSALDRASKLHCVNPFGSLMTGRTNSAGEYRYEFGGHEKDDEVKGVGNHITFGYFGYNPRLGRRWY